MADGVYSGAGERVAEGVIEAVFPLEEIAAAHRSLEKSGRFGKRVVQVA